MINLILVEDQIMLLDSMSKIFNSYEHINIIYKTTYADDLIDNPIVDEADVILMDIYTEDGSNGINVSKKIREKNKKVKIIIMTGMPSILNKNIATEAGANSFIYKNIEMKELVSIIQKSTENINVFQSENIDKPTWLKSLTKREFKILIKSCNGKRRKDIAKDLFLSESTIKSSVTSMLKKSSFETLRELVIFMISNGYIVPEDE